VALDFFPHFRFDFLRVSFFLFPRAFFAVRWHPTLVPFFSIRVVPVWLTDGLLLLLLHLHFTTAAQVPPMPSLHTQLELSLRSHEGKRQQSRGV
jgi:hypothetical protein